jgi:hypothetical protein
LIAVPVRADEVSLFDSHGVATAYIDMDDEFTIYAWDGKPVAYLVPNEEEAFDVYGFNGKHLGWFANGVTWDHAGNATCAVKDALAQTELEPLKSLKELKPLRALKELAPLKPIWSNSFGDLPCLFFLATGEE